ncbi:hypothetical protein WJX79_010957 [Trebouxia sp. C0005]
MHCGFAMLSIGCVRAKFAKHIAILILVDATASALGFYLFGFAFAYGDDASADGLNPAGNAFIGKNFFAMNKMAPTAYYNWVFQWTFAATACTIVSGAIAERTRFEAYILYSLFMSSWVYPVLIHSIWSSSGWASAFRKGTDINSLVGGGYLLFGSGAIDFAGSGAVHMVGGYAAFAGAWVLGPRIGRFLPDGTSVDMAGHNTSLFVLGVMILWFGWYGFNPGSQLAIVTPTGSTYSIASAVSNAAVTTSLAPAAAGLTGLFVTAILLKVKTGKHHWDIMAMGNSTLAGLVAITAGCSTVYPWAAVTIGIVSGFIYPLASRLMVLIRIDDPLDAIAVHAFNGTWGVWAVGLFGAKNLINTSYGYNPYTEGDRHYGCFMGGGGHLLAAQVVYSIWLGAWVLANMFTFFYVLKLLGYFRVNAADEAAGLDASHHGGSAYPMDLDDDASHKGSSYNGNQSGYNKNELDSIRSELASLRQSIGKNRSADNGMSDSVRNGTRAEAMPGGNMV